MDLTSLKNAKGARKDGKRVGRGDGSGHGRTSCRGEKGQMSRSGHKRRPGFEGGQMRMIRRIPKRGFTNATRVSYVPVNISALKDFMADTVVDADALRNAGLASGSGTLIKILGVGELDRKLTVKAHAFSASARAKIEAAGGKCEVLQG